MITIKYVLSIFGLFMVLSCGQADTTSSNANAESKVDILETDQKEDQDTPLAQTVSLESKEKISETKELVEEVKEKEIVSGNIENPKPVKASQKIKKEPIKPKVKPVVEKITESAKSFEIEPIIDKEVKKASEEIAKTDLEIADRKPVVEKAPEPEPVKEIIAEFSHENFNNLLKKHVTSSGKVNYNNFKTDESKLDAYLKALDSNPPVANWSKKKKMAYWINAYNAGTIKLILKNYPVKKITNLHGGKPWDQKWIPLGGEKYSLNNIENDILRPVYKDARIHFAVNCAAKSCPPLLNKAWTEGNLNSTLERQTKSFINDASQNTISADAVEISKIFEWYAVDFGDIITYLNKYSNVKINPGAKVTYKEYNWDLNK